MKIRLLLFIFKLISYFVRKLNNSFVDINKKIIIIDNYFNNIEMNENNEFYLLSKSKMDFMKKETIKFDKCMLLLNHWIVNEERIDNHEYIMLDKSKIVFGDNELIEFNKYQLLTDIKSFTQNIKISSDKFLISKDNVTFISNSFLKDKTHFTNILHSDREKVFIITGTINNLINIMNHFLSVLEYRKVLIDNYQENTFFEKQRKIENRSFNIIEQQLINDDKLILGDNILNFYDKRSMLILINELLVTEDYYFKTDNREPLIIDCGSNFGLSLFYYKKIYPKSKIICFEPLSSMREILKSNIDNNKWSNIQVEPYALWKEDCTMTFKVPVDDSMAGSLTERRLNNNNFIEENVKCTTLSKYLNQKIDFLKIDIEGAELDVLIESKEFLKNVNYLFCEYHHALQNPNLGKIITILEEVGFDINITKSYSYSRGTRYRPFNYLNDKEYLFSASIYCKNKNFCSSL